MNFDPSQVQVGLGHGKTATEKLDEKQVHQINGHRVIFIQSDDVLKAVCKRCGVGREVPFLVKVRPAAKKYILGEFLVESDGCTHSK